MRWTPAHRLRFGLFRSRREIETDVEAEIEFHLQMRAAELEEQGLSSEQAREEAKRLFGDRFETQESATERIGEERVRCDGTNICSSSCKTCDMGSDSSTDVPASR